MSARPLSWTDILAAGAAAEPAPAQPRAGIIDADSTATELYGSHYRSLVRLAALLIHDAATAEQVVQDSFVAMHARMYRLRDAGTALTYLRAAIVSRSRSALGSERAAPALPGRSAVVDALRNLPERQREVIVLRYYGDLSGAQVAAALGITLGAVERHATRAMAALRPVLGSEL